MVPDHSAELEQRNALFITAAFQHRVCVASSWSHAGGWRGPFPAAGQPAPSLLQRSRCCLPCASACRLCASYYQHNKLREKEGMTQAYVTILRLGGFNWQPDPWGHGSVHCPLFAIPGWIQGSSGSILSLVLGFL